MLKTLTPLFGAVLLAASATAFAQGTPPAGDGKGHPRDCSQAKDPKACQERVDKMKAAHKKASAACESQQGQAHRDCMRHEMCAQSKDAAKCEAHFKEKSDAFNKAYDACKSSADGNAFRECMRKQRVAAKK